MDGGEEVSCGLVVARGDGTELFESDEEFFDQMARFVEFAVERAASATIGSGRDHHSLAGRRQWLDDTSIGVKRLVGDQRLWLHVRQQVVSAYEIVGFAAGQMEAKRIAKSIRQSMDLAAQSAARASDSLVLTGFFWAPALC